MQQQRHQRMKSKEDCFALAVKASFQRCYFISKNRFFCILTTFQHSRSFFILFFLVNLIDNIVHLSIGNEKYISFLVVHTKRYSIVFSKLSLRLDECVLNFQFLYFSISATFSSLSLLKSPVLHTLLS